MKSYKTLKNELRTRVMELQNSLSGECSSYMELSELSSSIYKSAKKYGLITEFRENGIL